MGVSNNDTVRDGKDYVKTFDVPYPMSHAPEVWELFDVPYQPVTIVIDAEGRIVERLNGPVTYEQLRDALAEVL